MNQGVVKEDHKKWINSFVGLVSGLAAYVFYRFSLQICEWFEVEAKVRHLSLWLQAIAVILCMGVFIFSLRSEFLMKYLSEVFDELTKVIWPDTDSVTKLTIGIVVSLAIVSVVFVSVDFIVKKLFSLFY